MDTNFYGVNLNNGRFRLTTDVAARELLLTQQNYKDVSAVAAEFAQVLRAQLATDAGTTCTVASVTPAAGTALNATSDRVISFELDFASPHSFTVFRVQCFGEVGDSLHCWEATGSMTLPPPHRRSNAKSSPPLSFG